MKAFGSGYPVNAIGLWPNGELMMNIGARTNFSAGNNEFFDPDSPRLVQLRPMLSSDVDVSGMGRQANAILWAQDDVLGMCHAFYVRVPPHLRKNNRAGVMRAVQYVEKTYGARMVRLLAPVVARTPWRDPDRATP